MSEYEQLSLVELRVEARKLGIKSVTSYKKKELLEKVQEVAQGNGALEQTADHDVEPRKTRGRKSSRQEKDEKEGEPTSQEHRNPDEIVTQTAENEEKAAKQQNGEKSTQKKTETVSEKASSRRQDSKTVSHNKRKENDNRMNSHKRENDGRSGGYRRETDARSNAGKRETDNRTNHKREYDAKNASYKKNMRPAYQNTSVSRNNSSGQGEQQQPTVMQGKTMQNQSISPDRTMQQGQKRIQDLSPAEMEQQDSGIEREGILEVLSEGYGFIRCDNFLPGERDIYVAPAIIRKYHLRTGDILSGNLRVKSQNEKFGALLYLKSVNGCSPESVMNRIKFEKLTPVFPNERIRLETPGSQISMRMMDLISPIGKGQRGMIVSQPKTGKTTLLKQVAKAVKTNHPKMHLIVLLIDERPEEVTDIKESIMGHNVDVIYSTFDELPENHKRVSEMVIERAKRLVEHGQDVMILLDSITRLARAYNLTVQPSGRTLSGGLDPAALYMPKRFFGAARNMREGGSLTILATALVDTGSKMDDVVFEEFKGTGNMELVLDRRLSEKRVFPAIDLPKSSTRREDLLLTQEEIEANYLMRKAFNGVKSDEAVEKIIEMFRRTKNNQEFIQLVRKVKIV